MAEIVWFTRFNDYNGNEQPNPGELTLHRRVLLVLPNLDLSDPAIQALSPLAVLQCLRHFGADGTRHVRQLEESAQYAGGPESSREPSCP